MSNRREQQAPGSRLARFALAGAVFAVSLALYLFTFDSVSDGQILGNDVLPYARSLASGNVEEILSPHHLGHHVVAWLLLQAKSLASGSEPDMLAGLEALRATSALGGALAVSLLFVFTSRRCNAVVALLLAGAYAFSAGTWLYAAVGESYLPATATLALLLCELLDTRLENRQPRTLRIAALLVLALAFRQDSILVVPLVLLLVPRREGVISIALAGVATLGLYAGVHAATGTELEFGVWLRGLAETGLWGQGIDGFRLWVSAVTMQHALHYGVRFWGTESGALATLVSIATPILLVVGALLARRGSMAGVRRAGATHALLALFLFVVLRLVFFTWWQPGNMEYHTPSLWPLFAMLALALPNSVAVGRAVLIPFAVAVALLAIGNGLWLIGPNRGAVLAERCHAALESAASDDVVLALDSLGFYALERQVAIEARAARPTPRIVDATSAALGAIEDIDRIAELSRLELKAGRSVVLIRELELNDRMAFPENRVAPEFRAALNEALAEFDPQVDSTTDSKGRVWLLRYSVHG